MVTKCLGALNDVTASAVTVVTRLAEARLDINPASKQIFLFVAPRKFLINIQLMRQLEPR